MRCKLLDGGKKLKQKKKKDVEKGFNCSEKYTVFAAKYKFIAELKATGEGKKSMPDVVIDASTERYPKTSSEELSSNKEF